jgi:hypothetical protein
MRDYFGCHDNRFYNHVRKYEKRREGDRQKLEEDTNLTPWYLSYEYGIYPGPEKFSLA